MTDFLKNVLVATLSQLLIFPGLLLLFGLVLYLLARMSRLTLAKSAGDRAGIYLTGWIGVPVHELGHAFFCLLFGHKINKISFFDPGAEKGTLGFVNHSYNSRNLFHQVGNFFIGIGPMIMGTVIIFLLMFFLLPSLQQQLAPLQNNPLHFDGNAGFYPALFSVFSAAEATTGILTRYIFDSDYRFWIFLYISICIASYMELSPSDLKGAAKGFLALVILVLVLNMILEGMGMLFPGIFAGSGTFIPLNQWLNLSGFLLIFATIISGIHFLILYSVLSAVHLMRGRGLINPLW
jgi:hypothetical protein